MEKRYPKSAIGYSGHEEEDNFLPSICAVAAGAKIIERHFSDLEEKNNYSIGSNKLKNLLSSIDTSLDLMGSSEKKISKLEKSSISNLQRGIFAKKTKPNSKFTHNDFYLVFQKQVKRNKCIRFIKRDNFKKFKKSIEGSTELLKTFYVRKYIHRYKYMLNKGIVPGDDCHSELSHHYIEKN